MLVLCVKNKQYPYDIFQFQKFMDDFAGMYIPLREYAFADERSADKG